MSSETTLAAMNRWEAAIRRAEAAEARALSAESARDQALAREERLRAQLRRLAHLHLVDHPTSHEALSALALHPKGNGDNGAASALEQLQSGAGVGWREALVKIAEMDSDNPDSGTTTTGPFADIALAALAASPIPEGEGK